MERSNLASRREPVGEDANLVADVRVEHLSEPLGVGTGMPRLSWWMAQSAPGWQQTAYEVQLLGGPEPETTGWVPSAESVLIPWPFEPLDSRAAREVRVRVQGGDRTPTGWSDAVRFEIGLLVAEDWCANAITPAGRSAADQDGPAHHLRRKFVLHKPVTKARLYVTAFGVYEPHVNGTVVGDHVLAPGWTSYEHRLRYQTFDVTDRLVLGANVVGAILADGWYRGRLGWGGGRRNIYGDRVGLFAQLEVEYADGTKEVVTTDDQWRSSVGPILATGLYEGEIYDARLTLEGWCEAEYDDNGWALVEMLSRPNPALVAPTGPPVRRIEYLSPIAITRTPAGKTLVDFGQNLVGRLRITVSGEAGHTVTLRHAEVLEDGEIGIRHIRTAIATDRYTLRGDAIETWEPRFTFHGFRYAQVDNWPGELRPEDITAVVVHSDLERTGWFECSDDAVNRLHDNVIWSMRGNFLDIPTDCPQRDERLGWTGDIQIFGPTGAFLYDVSGFLESWLADLAAEQHDDGQVPNVIPDVIPHGLGDHDHSRPAAAWGDAAVIVPWVLYERYADARILHTQFDSMRRWVDLVARLAGPSRLWNTGFQYGDWLDPSAPPDRPEESRTDPSLVATAYFARSTEIVGRAAAVIGLHEEARHYASLSESVATAFRSEYVSEDGALTSDSPTAYAIALEFNLLLDSHQRANAARRLAELAELDGFRIGTGFVGTPLICDALSASGRVDTAYRLLLERSCPSWLYPVTMDATTIWERWDSMLPDGSINPGEMTSFNHYALGAVADWLHRVVAGLAPLEPGYRQLEIRPLVGGGLTHAGARHLTPYGEAESRWHVDEAAFHLAVVIPPSCTAVVHLPGRDRTEKVGSGSHRWSIPLREAAPAVGPSVRRGG